MNGHASPVPKALFDAPPSPPHELTWMVNAEHRIVRIVYRGHLDLAKTVVDLPWWVLKDAAATIGSVESQAERAGVPFPRIRPMTAPTGPEGGV